MNSGQQINCGFGVNGSSPTSKPWEIQISVRQMDGDRLSGIDVTPQKTKPDDFTPPMRTHRKRVSQHYHGLKSRRGLSSIFDSPTLMDG